MTRAIGPDTKWLSRSVVPGACGLALVLASATCMPVAWAQSTDDLIPVEQINAAVDQPDDLVEAVMTDTAVPGLAVAVVHQGKTLFAKGYGVRESGKPEPVDADTVFQIASLSKPVSARFDIADDGRVQSFTVEFLNEYGLAVFSRGAH